MAINKSQRVVLLLYCLLVTYCSIRIPWISGVGNQAVREGYSWLWSPPEPSLDFPDFSIIGLEVVAVTSIAVSAFLLAGKWKAEQQH
jgi:hypothetical protein